jgi:hypothetical protein
MKLVALNKITRWTICLGAVILAGFALKYNPGHLWTAAGVFAVGLNVEWKKRED